MITVIPTLEEEALAGMPSGERQFLQLLFEFTRNAQTNADRSVALAAKRWERTLRFKLAVTRQMQRHMRCTKAQIPDDKLQRRRTRQ